jgi:hypothetical protein
LTWEKVVARAFGLGKVSVIAPLMLFAAGSPDVMAFQASELFSVRVNLQAREQPHPSGPASPANPSNTGLCRSSNIPGAFGAVVTVVCATGVVVEIRPPDSQMPWSPIHGGAYRFLPPVSLAGVVSGLDFNTGLGTVTSWRIIHLTDREYLEMTVRW